MPSRRSLKSVEISSDVRQLSSRLKKSELVCTALRVDSWNCLMSEYDPAAEWQIRNKDSTLYWSAHPRYCICFFPEISTSAAVSIDFTSIYNRNSMKLSPQLCLYNRDCWSMVYPCQIQKLSWFT